MTTNKVKHTLVPKLRFNEYNDIWLNLSFQDIILKSNQGVNTTTEKVEYSNSGYIVVRSNNISENKISFEDVKYVDEDTFKKIKSPCKPIKGDILYCNIGSALGSAALFELNKEIVINWNVFRIQPNTSIVDNFFLTQYLNRIRKIMRGFATESTMPFISSKAFNLVKFTIPTLPEQHKIASFLGAVDEKIQLLTRKKELLENYKKGAMQQLFSQKLRFKDDTSTGLSAGNGKDFPEWEEKRFKDIYTFYSTNSLSREKLNYEGGSVKNIHYGDIHTKFKSHFDFKNELVPFINSDVDLSKIKNENYCQEGDLVIADASEDYADIGKSIEIINIQNEKVVAGLHTLLARPNKGEMCVGFSGHLLKSANFRKQLMIIAQGSKVLSISTGRVGLIKINLPSYNEQQKIASFLSAIDEKIEAVNQQITQSQTFKRGLLQKMFV